MPSPEAVEVVGNPRLASRRVGVALAGGVGTGAIALAQRASWPVSSLVGWDVAGLVFLVWVWLTISRADPLATARIARAEDASRTAAEAVLVGAGIASLLAVAFVLVQAGHSTAPGRGFLIALAVASVVLAWAAVHTVYLLRYARLYFSPPIGGIDFGDGAPDYRDFAYLALTIGMTFQVSDTALTAKKARRAAIHHALLSYLLGTVIVAITINVVAGLLGR